MAFNIIREARIAAMRDLTERLNDYMVDRGYEPEQVYRIRGAEDEEFCRTCAETTDDKMAAAGLAIEGQPYAHEAFERAEPVFCCRCGKALEYSLSSDGAVSAIHEFIDADRSFRGALLPQEAYEVHQMLMALHDLARFGNNDDLDEVWSGDYRNAITLGEMALGAIYLEPEQLDLFTGGPDGQEANIPRGERSSCPAAGS